MTVEQMLEKLQGLPKDMKIGIWQQGIGFIDFSNLYLLQVCVKDKVKDNEKYITDEQIVPESEHKIVVICSESL